MYVCKWMINWSETIWKITVLDDLDFWPTEFKDNMGHLFIIMNLHQNRDCMLKDGWVIDRKRFWNLQYWITLTFDLLSSKEIGGIYSSSSTSLPNMRTVGLTMANWSYTILIIIVLKDLDLWPTDPKTNKIYHLDHQEQP